jgi:hypothetical protein
VAKRPVTVPTESDVDAFLASVADEGGRADARTVCELMASVTGERAVLWGSSNVDLDVLRQLVDRSVRVKRGVDRASRDVNPA